MKRTLAQQARSWLWMTCIVGSSLIVYNCSSKKTENKEGMSSTAGSDSSVFGRQGDTTSNELNAPEQAPPDSADARGAVVPAEVKVKPK